MMVRLAALLSRFRANERGGMMIETAIITPVLVLFSLGSFQVSSEVAKMHELDAAAGEAEAVALSSAPDTDAKRTTLKQVIMASTGLTTEQVVVSAAYRCGSATDYVTDNTTCGSEKISNYVKIALSNTYQPPWANIGVGSPVNYSVTRYVMIKQEV